MSGETDHIDSLRRRGATSDDPAGFRMAIADLPPLVLAISLVAVLLLESCAPSPPEARSDATGPTEERSVTLGWNPPETDAEGNPLQDLAGYRIYYAESSPVTRTGAKAAEVDAETTEHRIQGLSAGVWYFSVAATDSSGNESGLSEELRADLR